MKIFFYKNSKFLKYRETVWRTHIFTNAHARTYAQNTIYSIQKSTGYGFFLTHFVFLLLTICCFFNFSFFFMTAFLSSFFTVFVCVRMVEHLLVSLYYGHMCLCMCVLKIISNKYNIFSDSCQLVWCRNFLFSMCVIRLRAANVYCHYVNISIYDCMTVKLG